MFVVYVCENIQDKASTETENSTLKVCVLNQMS